MRRKLVPILFLVLASLLLVLSLSLNAIIEKNRARIQEDLQKALGRTVAFGALRLGFWGGPAVTARDLTIAEDPRFAATPFIQTKELKIELRWLPLLAGRFRIEKFVLVEPEIQIIKNEAGLWNVATLAGRPKKPPPAGAVKEKKPAAAPKLLITGVEIKNGSVDFIDRTSREPAEVRLRRVDLALTGPRSAPAKVKFGADLFEGQGRNVMIDGEIGPWSAGLPWSQVPLDLKVRCDSLLLSQLTRAVPALRTTFLRYLDASGPLALRSKLRGTAERPQIVDLSLTGSFFGAPGNNTSVKGDLDFSRTEAWEDGEVKIRIVVDPLPLERLRALPFLQPALPPPLLADGPVSVSAALEGSLHALKIRAAVKGGKTEIVYGNWFRKARGVPAELALVMERQKDRLVFQDSALMLQNSTLKFSGAYDALPERRLALNVGAEAVRLAGLEKSFPPLAGYALGGGLGARLEIDKNLDSGALEIRGALDLDGVQVREKRGGRGLDRADGRISFRGRDARVERLALRAGASEIALEGQVADLSEPVLRYTLRAARLRPGDFTSAAYKDDEMKALAGAGELAVRDGRVAARASLTSADGALADVPYRNLRGDAAWSPAGLSLKNVSFQALGGAVRGGGSWETAADNSLRLALDAGVESMDVSALLARKFPGFEDRLDGRLSLKAQLRGESKNSSGLPAALEGAGEAQVRSGALKDLNLVRLALARLSGLPGMSRMRAPPRFAALAERRDTPFDSLTATFTVREGRAASKDLLLSAPEYSLAAEGSIGVDKSMRWEATLLLSPGFTRELAQEYDNVRYIADPKGRLAVPFHIEGTVSHIQARPDVERLEQQLRKSLAAAKAGTPGEGEKEPKKSPRERIQKGLEQLFGKKR